MCLCKRGDKVENDNEISLCGDDYSDCAIVVGVTCVFTKAGQVDPAGSIADFSSFN